MVNILSCLKNIIKTEFRLTDQKSTLIFIRFTSGRLDYSHIGAESLIKELHGSIEYYIALIIFLVFI